jgi:hypothetical protein
MNRAQRMERHARLSRDLQALPDQERGAVNAVFLVNALATVLLEITLAVVLARAARRGWRQRQLGPVRAAQAGLTPALGWAAAALGAYRVFRIWAWRVVNRQLAAHHGPELPPPS